MTKEIDLAPLRSLLKRFAGKRRESLLPLLHQAQALYGWLPREVQQAIAETLRVPVAEIHGVVEFYTMYYNTPTGRRVIRLCEDPACHLAGAEEIGDALGEKLGLRQGETDIAADITYEHVPCLGMCELAPAALNGERPAGELTPADVEDFISENYPEPRAKVYGAPLLALGRIGRVDPGRLSEYEANGGYRALRKALSEEADTLLARIEESGIVGRGGAMFPLGRKWRFTREASDRPDSKHIVVNADESEPGTFKDRCLMEGDPFALVEAATMAAYAVGAQNGWIFVRGEYPRSFGRLTQAVEQARQAGYLGQNIMGRPGFNFDIEMRLGAGAYICGEETALFEAIEGKRGFPRIKPPFPVTHGLFQQPTAVNNVETLVAALHAYDIGIPQWRDYGTEQSPGTKLFCLSGRIARPGIYEVPFGLTIGELITMAGGVVHGNSLKAVLMGGAAGVFIGPDRLEMPLTYEDSRAQNIPLGSGVIQVFDETVDLRQILFQLSRFFAHESCGKCFPCQLGTQRQMEILHKLASNGEVEPTYKQTLQDLGFAMSETSLCGLGQTAATAVLSAVELWPELAE